MTTMSDRPPRARRGRIPPKAAEQEAWVDAKTERTWDHLFRIVPTKTILTVPDKDLSFPDRGIDRCFGIRIW